MANPKIESWIASAVGRAMNPDGMYGLQCKDVVDDFCLFLFGDWVNTIRPENAKDAFDRANPDFFDKVRNDPNDPNQVPPRGAVVVCDGRLGGGDGHIFVVEGAGPDHVDAIEQDGFKQVPAYRNHYTASILDYAIGWLIPRLSTPDPAPVVVNQTEESMNDQQFKDAYTIVLGRAPEGGPDGRSAMQFIYDAAGELAQQHSAQTQQVAALQARVSELATATQNATDLVNKLQAELTSAGVDRTRLTDQVAALNERVIELSKTAPVLSPDAFSLGELVNAIWKKLTNLK